MRLTVFALVLVGCETMEPAGNPFEPVRVARVAVEQESVDPDTEPWIVDEPVVLITSEEQAAVVDAIAAGRPLPPEDPGKPAEPAAAPKVPPTDGAPPASSEGPVAAPGPAPAPLAAAPLAAAPAATGWPVRLVRTLPDTLPPRAILGLPDGSEIVVSPGTMVPAQGLVVVSIGARSAELARVTPVGDYAAIQQVTLSAQY
jgi:hypothetical protein